MFCPKAENLELLKEVENLRGEYGNLSRSALCLPLWWCAHLLTLCICTAQRPWRLRMFRCEQTLGVVWCLGSCRQSTMTTMARLNSRHANVETNTLAAQLYASKWTLFAVPSGCTGIPRSLLVCCRVFDSSVDFCACEGALKIGAFVTKTGELCCTSMTTTRYIVTATCPLSDAHFLAHACRGDVQRVRGAELYRNQAESPPDFLHANTASQTITIYTYY